jgi:pimeloyl-ACP methyl ester carboxylesterase
MGDIQLLIPQVHFCQHFPTHITNQPWSRPEETGKIFIFMGGLYNVFIAKHIILRRIEFGYYGLAQFNSNRYGVELKQASALALAATSFLNSLGNNLQGRMITPMQNLRAYGKAPFTIAVIHGGPGAGGEMAPVARKLAPYYGVLEPIQTAVTLEGQVQELRKVLESQSHSPVILIGFSWGAWLSFIVAARYPALIKKLILVGCAPFEERYTAALHEIRLIRLDADEKTEFESLLQGLNNPATKDKDRLLARLGALAFKADAYDALLDQVDETDRIDQKGDIFQSVWDSAAKMRRSGELLALSEHIQCPVVAIHGDHDPHPAEGVGEPLSGVLRDFRMVVLEKCGHTPWIERQARDRFYSVLEAELL